MAKRKRGFNPCSVRPTERQALNRIERERRAVVRKWRRMVIELVEVDRG